MHTKLLNGNMLAASCLTGSLYHLLVHVISFFFIHLVIKSIITFHVSFTECSGSKQQCKRREMQLHLTAVFWHLRED